MSFRLKPCPFCGGKAILSEDKRYNVHSVFCNECYIETSLQNTEQEAIDAWNTRVMPTFTPDELDAIRRNVCDWRAERELSKIEQSIIDKCANALKGDAK